MFRDPETKVSAISHFDEFTKMTGFTNMTKSFLAKVEKRLEGEWEYWDEDEVNINRSSIKHEGEWE